MADLKWQVQMHRDAWDKMWAYTDLLVGEVACFGYVELDEENKIAYVSEVFLVPQTASAAEVDFMTKGLPFAIEKALVDGKIDQLRFCVHSHGEYTANWSSTDEDMLRKVGSTGTPWFVSAIFNRKGDSTARIDIYGDAGPFGKTQHVLKDLEIAMERDWDYDEARLVELEQYVHVPPKVTPKPAVKALNRPAGTTTTPANRGKPDPDIDGYPAMMLEDKSTVVIMMPDGDSVVIDLDELPVENLMNLAQSLEWSWTEDSRGDRYYYDNHPDSNMFYCVESSRWNELALGFNETDNAVVAI